MKFDSAKFAMVATTVGKVDEIIHLPDPVAHIFVDEDALKAAVDGIYEDGAYMIKKMSQLEDNNPALLRLEDLITDSFPGAGGLNQMVQQARDDHQTTSQTIDDIDGVATITEFAVMIAASGALSAEGIGVPAGIILACRAGKDLWDLKGRVDVTNAQVEEMVQLSRRIHWTREEFDVVWGQTVLEDREIIVEHHSEDLELVA